MTADQKLAITEITNEMVDILSFGKRSKETIKTYKTYTVPFLEYCYEQLKIEPAQASEKDVRSFLIHIQKERDLSDRTINLAISSIHFLFSAVLDLPWNSLKVPFLSFEKFVPFVPSEEEMETFLSAIGNPRLKAVLTVMYASGLRVSEACALRYSDVDRENMLLHIAPSKRGKERYVALPVKAFEQMRDYCMSFSPETRRTFTKDSWIFPAPRSLEKPLHPNYVHYHIPSVEEKLGWKHRFMSHTFRRAYATHNYLSGNMTLEEVQFALGHSSQATTMLYIRSGSASLLRCHPNAIDSMSL